MSQWDRIIPKSQKQVASKFSDVDTKSSFPRVPMLVSFLFLHRRLHVFMLSHVSLNKCTKLFLIFPPIKPALVLRLH